MPGSSAKHTPSRPEHTLFWIPYGAIEFSILQEPLRVVGIGCRLLEASVDGPDFSSPNQHSPNVSNNVGTGGDVITSIHVVLHNSLRESKTDPPQ